MSGSSWSDLTPTRSQCLTSALTSKPRCSKKAFTGEYNSVSYFTAIVRAPFQKWPVSDHVLSGFLNLEPSLYHIRSFFLKAQDV
ncbi:hypothetical protein MT997_13385 [Paenibacillus sp. OVF10]|nr:hypothetical protein MT997_13385 [Paenibacillus sp. OVF10]